ncbi:hypothetical protein EAH_00012350 [Eimeria acervulina]|uniref:Uncharacterized protein n=1 Tax=Eimeria acervulina TaxID=5801 RepID=U6GMF2_EIMAC|nr:hypothetical protein EAH_00012350 [Eimeria acervulina]CDI79784.1 hypothetical protein EAH_00012350 [Eimeria acervulina]
MPAKALIPNKATWGLSGSARQATAASEREITTFPEKIAQRCCCCHRNVHLNRHEYRSFGAQEIAKLSHSRKDPHGYCRQSSPGAETKPLCPSINCDDTAPACPEEQRSAAFPSRSSQATPEKDFAPATTGPAPSDIKQQPAIPVCSRCQGNMTLHERWEHEHRRPSDPPPQSEKNCAAYIGLLAAGGANLRQAGCGSSNSSTIPPAQCRIASNISASCCGPVLPSGLRHATSVASNCAPHCPPITPPSTTSGQFWQKRWEPLPANNFFKAWEAFPTSWVHTLRGSSVVVPVWGHEGMAHRISRIPPPVIRTRHLRNPCRSNSATTSQISLQQEQQLPQKKGHYDSSCNSTAHRPLVNTAIQTENTHIAQSARDPAYTCNGCPSFYPPRPPFARTTPQNKQVSCASSCSSGARCRSRTPTHRRGASNNSSLGVQTHDDDGIPDVTRAPASVQYKRLIAEEAESGAATAAFQAAAELQAAAAAFGMAIGRLSSLTSPVNTNQQPIIPGIRRQGPTRSEADKKSQFLHASKSLPALNGHETSRVTPRRELSQREEQLLDCMAASFAAVNLDP